MMRNATFCGAAQGDSLSSRRPTSAVLAGCIPVLICDLCLYPHENLVEYSDFAVFVSEEDVMDGKLFQILRGIPAERIAAMRRALNEVAPRFRYTVDGPPRPGDALDTLVEQLQLRGMLDRQYRRWFAANANASSDMKDYPADPRVVKKYLRPGRGSTKQEERDFNNIGETLASMAKQRRG